MHLLKVLTLGQRLRLIAHTVTLQVGLSRQVDAILIAQVIPTGIVWIVAGTHGIDIQLLHDLDILDHALHRDDVAAVGIKFMTVGTLDEDRLTVDKQLAALDFNMAEAYLLSDNLKHIRTLLVFQRELQSI